MIFNHPITIRLAPTNYSGGPFGTNAVKWENYSDKFQNIVEHGATDGVYPDELIKVIPNTLYDIKNLCENPLDPDVLDSQIQEINSSLSDRGDPTTFYMGGAFINDSRAITHQVAVPTVGSATVFDVKGHASTFMDYARSKGETAFNLILHGRVNLGGDFPPPESPTFYESSIVPAPDNPGKIDNPDQFDNQDTTVSSYITFNSAEQSVTNSLSSFNISFRKSFHHNYFAVNAGQIAGITQTAGGASIIPLSSFSWTSAGLSANAVCTFAERTTPQESVTTNKNVNAVPNQITCSNKSMIFSGLVNGTAVFTNIATPNTLFNAPFPNQSVTATLNWGGNIPATAPYTIPIVLTGGVTVQLRIRQQNSISYGNKNYLGIKFLAARETRFFGGNKTTTLDIGITANSYIRISGSSIPSNNGIYQVISVQNGIPNDTNENTSLGSFAPFQYLELSRSITPEPEGSQITVENISHLPVLHVKYRELI